MTVHFEHLHVDLSPAAIAEVEQAIQRQLDDDSERSASVVIELQNLANECRARLQHVLAGEPDISEPEADWLSE